MDNTCTAPSSCLTTASFMALTSAERDIAREPMVFVAQSTVGHDGPSGTLTRARRSRPRRVAPGLQTRIRFKSTGRVRQFRLNRRARRTTARKASAP